MLSVSVSAHPVLGHKGQDAALPVHFYPRPPCTEYEVSTVKAGPFSQSAVSIPRWHAVGSEAQLFEDSVAPFLHAALSGQLQLTAVQAGCLQKAVQSY